MITGSLFKSIGTLALLVAVFTPQAGCVSLSPARTPALSSSDVRAGMASTPMVPAVSSNDLRIGMFVFVAVSIGGEELVRHNKKRTATKEAEKKEAERIATERALQEERERNVAAWMAESDPQPLPEPDDAGIALAHCSAMERMINGLVDYTKTRCLPGTAKKGMTFIFISSEPVFSDSAALKAWAMVVIGAFGNQFNGTSYLTDSLILSDMRSMQQRTGYKIPADTAKSLQRRIKADQLTLEEFYAGIGASMKRFTIEPE